MIASNHRTFDLAAGVLSSGGKALLTGIGTGVTMEADACAVGAFLTAGATPARQRLVFSLGQIAGLDRFMACYQDDPFWMLPAAGNSLGAVPAETQFLLVRRQDGACLLLVPLFSENMRFALQGAGDHLELVGETADAFTVAAGGLAVFVAAGTDPYALIPQAAASVALRLGTGKLRREKPLPSFVDSFGWCTWDAFYRDVSADKVREGLTTLKQAGVPPRFLILDDGWQSTRLTTTGELRLTGFAANAKFPGDLRALVDMAKQEFGLAQLLVWHAVMGYWGGVDADALPGYAVRDTVTRLPRTLAKHAGLNDWQGTVIGVVPPATVARFYHDYHLYLQAQGVDGVKIDNQSAILYLSDRLGGRVNMFRAYRRGLEHSVAQHFNNTVINCMAGTTEVWYHAQSSNLMRTSTDFWPNQPETHGLHLCTNAAVCVWFSEFLHADWDMFQSGHPMGAFHAAGRAVSGAPVYVSDKPGTHNAELLRKLVCRDGTTLRCLDLGRPTPDCLYHDCTKEEVLLKIFNRNAHGWVVGVFNARYHADPKARSAVTGRVSPADVPGLAGDEFVLYAHRAGRAVRVTADGSLELSLTDLEWEIVTIAPLRHGVAVIGLADKLNPGGAVRDLHQTPDHVVCHSRDGGTFLLVADRPPAAARSNGTAVACSYISATGVATLQLPDAGEVSIAWTEPRQD